MLIVLLYRSAIAAFFTGVIIWSGFSRPGTNATWLIYLSNWSVSFVALYFICAAIVTAIHFKNQRQNWKNTARDQHENQNDLKMAAAKRDEESSSGACEPRDKLVNLVDVDSEVVVTGDALETSRASPMNWFHEAVWVIYNIAAVAAFLVTISYYTFFGGEANAISLIFHAVNSFVMIGDTMLSSIPVRLFHVVYPMLYTTAYCMFTVIYWASGGASIYPITDYTGRPVFSAVTQLCMFFIVLPLCQILLFCFFCLRVWIKTKYLR